MTAGLYFIVIAIFIFFCQPGDFTPHFHQRIKILLCWISMDCLWIRWIVYGWATMLFYVNKCRSTKICRRKIALRYEVSFAIVRSTNHGLICLALPSKLFEVDLIVCMDIPPNPGSELGFELKST